MHLIDTYVLTSGVVTCIPLVMFPMLHILLSQGMVGSGLQQCILLLLARMARLV